MKTISTVLFGNTGSGKSTLANTLIGRNFFKESEHLKAQTTETLGQHGIFDSQSVFVIDTPGLQDTEGRDQQHLNQMTNYIRSQPNIQAFIFVINFMNVKMDESVIRLFQLMKQMFPNKKWYHHVAVVWTNYFSSLTNQIKLTSISKEQQFRKLFKEKIEPEITQQELNAIPQIFIDSVEARNENSESRNKLSFLLSWIAQLQPLNKTLGTINNVNKDVMKEEIQTEKRVVSDITELNIRTIETATFERTKKTMYNGKILYSDWKEKIGSRKKEKKVLPPPPPKVITEFRETEKFTDKSLHVYRDISKPSNSILALFGDGEIIIKKGTTIKIKNATKESRTVTTHFNGKVEYGPWNTVSKEEIWVDANTLRSHKKSEIEKYLSKNKSYFMLHLNPKSKIEQQKKHSPPKKNCLVKSFNQNK